MCTTHEAERPRTECTVCIYVNHQTVSCSASTLLNNVFAIVNNICQLKPSCECIVSVHVLTYTRKWFNMFALVCVCVCVCVCVVLKCFLGMCVG